MSSAPRNHRRTATFENREGRRLLAGNVTGVLDGSGRLWITGDDTSNDVVIVALESTTTVTGRNGTTVNGLAAAAEYRSFPNLLIDTGGGDDAVELTDLFQDVVINTGNGDDGVSVTHDGFGTLVDGDLVIDTGNGNDSVNLHSTAVISAGPGGGTVSMSAGNGNDVLTLRGDFFIEGRGRFDMGRGVDVIDPTGLATHETGEGTEILGNETLLT